MSYDYIIAVDLGTTTTAWAFRKPSEKIVKVVSPITNQDGIQRKTSSDIHFFLKSEKEHISFENSLLGNDIPKKFEDPLFQIHLHYSCYKIQLYWNKEQEIRYPDVPLASAIDKSNPERVSMLFKIVIQHIRRSIEQYFQQKSMILDVDKIAWIVTVPAMAHQEQKDFMKQSFLDGMGKFKSVYGIKPIDQQKVQIALEPESGLLNEIMFKPEYFEQDQVVAIFDFGGGTFDLTVVKAVKGQTPEMVLSDFGEVMGGGDIDREFESFIEYVTQFSKAKVKQKERQIVLSQVLLQFLKQKEEKMNLQESQFEIDLQKMMQYLKKDTVEQQVLQLNDDPEDPDVSLQNSILMFSLDFAKRKFIKKVIDKLVAKTNELKNVCIEKGYNISLALMVGGFSACNPLMFEIRKQFSINIINPSEDASVQIVKGATFTDVAVKMQPDSEVVSPSKIAVKVQKCVQYSIGLQVMREAAKIPQDEQALLKTPAVSKYIKNGVCQVAVLPLFIAGTKIDNKTLKYIPNFDFRIDKTMKHLLLRIYVFKQDIPSVYVPEMAVQSHRISDIKYTVPIPPDKPNSCQMIFEIKENQDVTIWLKFSGQEAWTPFTFSDQ